MEQKHSLDLALVKEQVENLRKLNPEDPLFEANKIVQNISSLIKKCTIDGDLLSRFYLNKYACESYEIALNLAGYNEKDNIQKHVSFWKTASDNAKKDYCRGNNIDIGEFDKIISGKK